MSIVAKESPSRDGVEVGGGGDGIRTPTRYAAEQNAVQQGLAQLVNGGFGSGRRALAAVAGFRRAWDLEARPVADAFNRLTSLPLPPTSPVQEVAIEPYAGRAQEVLAVRDFVAAHLADDLVVCMLHGSVATGEAITYSDVDALVVLKDAVVRSPKRLSRAARKLSRARSLMYTVDSLQHHGWFVLTEQDLRCHCEAFFPTVLFRYGAALVPQRRIEVNVAVRDSRAEMAEGFRSLAAAVRSRMDGASRPSDLYELKTLLSQLMLLPSMYIQIRDGAGVWKGRSFALAKPDFTERAWRAVETASAIRRRWPELRGLSLRWVHGPVAQKIAKRTAPAIPSSVRAGLTEEFYASAAALIEEMELRIHEIHVCDRHGSLRDEVYG